VFMSVPPPRITHVEVAAPDLTAYLDGAVAKMAAASAETLRWVAEFDCQKMWTRDGATSMSSWLAARYGLAWGTARAWVRVSHALQELPRIEKAYRRGRLSWDQLRPLARFATPKTDALWARRAPGMRPAGLWQEARRHAQIRAKEAEDTHRHRYLSLQWDHERPVLWLEGMLGAEQGAALETALNHRAERLPADRAAVDPGEARLADALVDLAGGADPQPGTLVIHAGADVLTGRESKDGPVLAETESGRRLTSDAVRRLACDSKVEWILEEHGRPVGIGRRGRVVPGTLGRVLRHRDRTCRFPGCDHIRWLHAHHLVHWAYGGHTTLDNLMLLCGFHHRLVHEGGWKISGHPGRNLRFHDPGGRSLQTHPLETRPKVQMRQLL
jgi:Domain of unknown function (DUF222)/HNH endonuclease